jgi:predicted DNA-binding transcriptional regulator YafY
VCAFLNTTDGGTLYLGVNDLGYVQGIEGEIAYLQTITCGNYKGIDGYMRYITDQAKQFFDIDVVANIKIRPMYDNKVLALEISPYEFGIVKLEDVAYLRVNAESVAINEAAELRISSRKKLTTVTKNSTIENLSKAIRTQHCVVLHNYQSSNSGNIRDRMVEVFDFTENGVSVWCYDLEKKDVRLFNIARIGYVEVTKQSWINQDKHKCGNIDIFNMTGNNSIDVCLRLNLRAKNLLIEEFPRAKDCIVKENSSSWLLNTQVYNIAGVARFYMGLANSIQIVRAPELTAYIKEYCKTYLNF